MSLQASLEESVYKFTRVHHGVLKYT